MEIATLATLMVMTIILNSYLHIDIRMKGFRLKAGVRKRKRK